MATLAHVLAFLVSMTSVLQAPSREFSSEELPQLASDFQLEYNLFDRGGTPITDDVVHDFVRINIHGVNQIVGTHELAVYLDGLPVHSRSDVRLPFDLKWNFKGLLDGPHTMLIIFTDAEDRRGLVRLELAVQH